MVVVIIVHLIVKLYVSVAEVENDIFRFYTNEIIRFDHLAYKIITINADDSWNNVFDLIEHCHPYSITSHSSTKWFLFIYFFCECHMQALITETHDLKENNLIFMGKRPQFVANYIQLVLKHWKSALEFIVE